MPSRVKEVFEQLCSKLVIDEHFCTKVHLYQTSFISKNEDHSTFFGGNLLGVQVVRFTDADKNLWFDEVLEADEEHLRENLHVIPELQNENGVFNVAGDPMNLSLAWVVHRIHSAAGLKIEVKREAMIDALLIMQIKFMTSRLYRLFRFPADRAVAEATYMRLSNKYAIKTHGSWLAVLRARCEDILRPSGIHENAISRMDSDIEIVRMISDIQGRIRDMLKNIYAEFLEVNKQGLKITSQSSVIEYDGVEALKDRTVGLQTYTRYIKSVVGEKNSFVREELLYVVYDIVPNCPPKALDATLTYVSNNHLRNANDQVDRWLEDVMVHSFQYLEENRKSIRANIDLSGLLARMKGVYTSSRSTNPDLLKLRLDTEKFVRKAIQTKTEAVIASVRTATLLYVVARAYTKKHYEG